MGVEEGPSTPKEIKHAPEILALVLASAISNISGAFMTSNSISTRGTTAADAAEPTSSSTQNNQLLSHHAKKQGSVQASLANFDHLPDSAYVRQAVLLGLFSCSKATLWRWVKSSRIPSPVKLGNRLSAWQVGPLRGYLRRVEASAHKEMEGGYK